MSRIYWFLLILFSLFVFTLNVQASTCFEPATASVEYSPNRYVLREIYAITAQADNTERIKVWVDTPNCKRWIDRGCVLIKTKIGEYCEWVCADIHSSKYYHVYDSQPDLRKDASVRNQIYSCFLKFADLWI